MLPLALVFFPAITRVYRTSNTFYELSSPDYITLLLMLQHRATISASTGEAGRSVAECAHLNCYSDLAALAHDFS